MLNRLSYKQRNIGLLVLTIVFGFLVWNKAIKGTLTLMDDCERLEEQLELAGDAPNQLQLLEGRLASVNNIVGNEGTVHEAHQRLLEQVSGFCALNELHVKHFPEPITFKAQGFSLVTGVAEVEGRFHELIQLLNELEQSPEGFKVASVRFFSERHPRTKKLNLYARIYFQNIRQA